MESKSARVVVEVGETVTDTETVADPAVAIVRVSAGHALEDWEHVPRPGVAELYVVVPGSVSMKM